MRVLFATDGFKPARVGEKVMAALFDRAKVSIDVLAVEPNPLHEVLRPHSYLEMKRLDVPVLGAEGVAREAAEHLEDAGFVVSFSSRRGDPVDEIVAVAADGTYELIVVGASHDSWLGNSLLGSVSTHVLHEAGTSVLVAHRVPTGEPKVLFGVDGSTNSLRAVELGARVLDPSRCKTEIATVIDIPFAPAAVYLPGVFPGAADIHVERERDEWARRLTRPAMRSLSDHGFEVDDVVLTGGTTSQLLKEADNIGADLVVVGSRGLGAIRRTLLGSIGEQMARHAPAALIVRNPAKPRG